MARILRPRGRRGEVVAESLSGLQQRFETLHRLYLGTANGIRVDAEPVEVDEAGWHQGRLILKLRGVDSIAAAESLRGRLLLVRREDRATLPPGQYYVDDLEGCQVQLQRGNTGHPRVIGSVTAVEETPGGHLLHVTRSGSPEEVLIPFAQAICTHVDVNARVIVIDPPDDLLELNRLG